MDELSKRCIDTIRTLSIDAIETSNSGHPGLPMGAAPMAFVLWDRHLRHNPRDPAWPNRDRFVLSAGHGSMLLYSLLHLTGYGLSIDELKSFRQWGSKTPGHPESFITDGVEATTGPLGQGAANAVGMAMAERHLASRFNRPGHEIVEHYTYALVSDGDIMEGVAAEAASLAGHLGLGRLIYLYDFNNITLDGPASLAFSEDVCKRYEAYGWHVQRVDEGDTDLDAIDAAIAAAKAERERPSLILVNTTIGYGSPKKAGTSSAHGAPLGADETKATKAALGWPTDAAYLVPDEVRAHMAAAGERGATAQTAWQEQMHGYAKAHPELAEAWRQSLACELPAGWDSESIAWDEGAQVATRSAGAKVIQALTAKVPWLLGGDADLGCSTKTLLPGGGDFDGASGAGRNIHFGVREHAMGSICNGMEYHGGVRSYAATFFVFSDYMRPAVRLAALNRLPVIYIWTHDSIGVGEDGPTHQPVEQLMSLRAMPNLHVVRPADARETEEAWRHALVRTDGPTALVFSRQNLPVLARPAAIGEGPHFLARGAYVLVEADKPEAIDVILMATGSEVSLAVAARALLAAEGLSVRVVSMPCMELFRAQSEEYRESVLPAAVRARVSVEAGSTFGWAGWVGLDGESVGLDRFGASAPGEVLMEKFGFTADNIAAAARRTVERNRSRA
ncbi:transketolase [Haliangium ochraceum]|uniref:Transketolase n=1 Tax=Haliangium ochraceum (strain DSM 14365 / JCM 11303 / SMP-2) TaxID=502025 RepID=D0LZB6_HALO1|nr:transketolase [Haliangium ochraceum]ACY16378.1 transketolase [Haliangium ochraceum DSM 14365]